MQVASNTEAGPGAEFQDFRHGNLGRSRAKTAVVLRRADSGPAAAGRDARPGGGLGPPIDAPDPLEKYRWYILGAFAVILAAGAVYITKHSRSAAFRAGERSLATITDFGASDVEVAGRLHARQPASGRAGLLLEALKEELFELEVEHKQGSISQQEYDRARAALDQTLERAIKRGASPPKNASARD